MASISTSVSLRLQCLPCRQCASEESPTSCHLPSDVLELDKPNEFSLGRQLRIQGKYTYSDLDELIVSHVRAMARKVDEMMHSDKYKGSEADLSRSCLSSRGECEA